MNDVTASQVTSRERGWIVAGLRRLRNLIGMSVSLSVAVVVPAAAQQFPEVPLYELLAPNHSYPLARVCYTQAGTWMFPRTSSQAHRARAAGATGSGSPAWSLTDKP
jgi:hypothetical protein